ncbi:MAG: AEC family transporter [Oscillospiraceae bacterium]|nr:AEC family transporter [Oscillospiraceae bacterium]
MMETMIPVFLQMLVLFLLIGIGYLGGKTRVMTVEGNKSLSKLVNCITNPCNILYSSLCGEHLLRNGEVLTLLGLSVAMYVFLIAAAQLIPKLLKVPQEQAGQYKFMMIYSNVGFMGIPVVTAVFGPDAVFCVSVIIMVFYMFLFTHGIYLICGGKGGFDWKSLITPMTVSSAVSIVSYLCRFQVSGVLQDTLNMLRNVTTPCAMLIIGCALSAIPFKSVFSNWRLYVVSFLKLLVIPCIIYLCLRGIVSNPVMLGVIVVIMAMPIASSFTMLTAQYDKDQSLAAASVFITTLLSVITIPLLAGVLNAG